MITEQCFRVRRAAKEVLKEGQFKFRRFHSATEGNGRDGFGSAAAYFELPSHDELGRLQRAMPQGFTARDLYTLKIDGWVIVCIEEAK